jgi:protein Tex
VPGLVLEGVVTNVAAFGAFVDIGVHQDGLVHVSAMSRNFVSDPREVARSGDVVRVKVLSVDTARKRISLTMRLDDEPAGAGQPRGSEAGRGGPGERPGRGRQGGGSGRDGAGRGGPDRGGRGGAGSGGGAMADALRRAGLAGGSDKSPRQSGRPSR